MNRRFAAVLVVAALVSALCASSVLAQPEKPLRFGVKLGLDFADFRGTGASFQEDMLDWKTGLIGGVFLSYDVNDWLTLQPELIYAQKGMKLGLFTFSALTINLDYIEMPVLAVAKLPLKSKLKPFIYAGPVIGFNVRSKASTNLFETEFETSLSDVVQTTEFSLAVGVGITVRAWGREIILDGRYEPGLTDAFKKEPTASSEAINWKNDTIAILAGITF